MNKLRVMGLICALMGMVLPAFASTYYVSPAGNDSADGSAGTPWKTIQHAADHVVAGDTVIVHPGAYAGFVLGWDFPQNGTPSNPILFLADPGAVINHRNNKTADGINLEGASYVHIEGFTIQNDGSVTRAGIRSVTNANAVVRGNTVDGMGTWGIFTGFSENVLIENNETSHSVSQHGIYVSNSADNPIIRGNESWGNNGCGIHMNGDLSMGGDGIISGALVEGNRIHDNGSAGGSGINCDGVQDSVIQNNLLYNNHASGISLYAIDGAEGSKNNQVLNNTIIEAANGRWAINIQNGSTGNTVLNNILFNNHSWHGSITISTDSLPGFRSDSNIVENRFTTDDGSSVLTLSQWQTQTGQDLNSMTAPHASVFLNVGANDYHLSATSPGIDHGTPASGVTVDIEGSPRPQGLGWDIGAYEYPSLPPYVSLQIALVNVGDNNIKCGYWDSDGNFSGLSPIGGASTEPPAIAVFTGRKYMAVKGAATNNIFVRYQDNTGTWSSWSPLSGSTNKSPALAVFNNRLYMVVKGAVNNSLFVRSMDGPGVWGPSWTQISGTTSEAPALAVLNNRLYLFVKGAVTNNIFYRSMSTSGVWDSWTTLPGGTSKPIGLATFNNMLYLFAKGAVNNNIFYQTMDASATWSGWLTLPGQTSEAPSVTVLGDTLYVAVKGAASGNVFLRSMDLLGSWDASWTMVPANTHKTPVLSAF